MEVEIDDSKLGRRKHNRDPYTEGHWVFEGVQRLTGQAFLVEVEQRGAGTHIPIIERFIRPGTTILSDEWRAYCRIDQIPGGGGATHTSQSTTQGTLWILRQGPTHNRWNPCWAGCKHMTRKEGTMHNSLFETYLPEFMWRKQFDTPFLNAFENIIKHIAEQYPLL